MKENIYPSIAARGSECRTLEIPDISMSIALHSVFIARQGSCCTLALLRCGTMPDVSHTCPPLPKTHSFRKGSGYSQCSAAGSLYWSCLADLAARMPSSGLSYGDPGAF